MDDDYPADSRVSGGGKKDGILAHTLPLVYDILQEIFRIYQGEDLSDREIRLRLGTTEEKILRQVIVCQSSNTGYRNALSSL